MAGAFLLKTGHFDMTAEVVELPSRAAPNPGPQRGDLLFIWHNETGLVAETSVLGATGATLTLGAKTSYADPLPASWLDSADRAKTTLRSKIHCDRHDRLWRLGQTEITELDAARRFGWQD